MTEWRFGRGWRVDELGPRLHALASLAHNFDTPEHEMTTQNGWNNYYLESVVARDEPGDHTKFERLTRAVSNYEFSEPRIVRAHFDRASQLLGRRMLLDIQALRLHYLCPVMVTAVRDDETDEGKVAPSSFKEVGSGGLDFPAILKAAASAGVSHLFVEQDQTPGDPIASLKQSYDYLHKLA